MAWLTGTASQRALGGGTGRTFRDQHAWCWNIQPEIPVTGQVDDEVQVDGIYLRSGWCALIAIADQHVIGWQWCDREKRAAWAALHVAAVPSWTWPRQTWWYTHERLRKSYRLLAKLARKDVLFTYLDPAFDGLGISSTTNQIEGGINAQLRTMLKAHRGMSPHHARSAIEWWCYQHSENPSTPSDLIQPAHWQPPAPTTVVDQPDGPIGYDTHTSADEGLWARKGWAGHT